MRSETQRLLNRFLVQSTRSCGIWVVCSDQSGDCNVVIHIKHLGKSLTLKYASVCWPFFADRTATRAQLCAAVRRLFGRILGDLRYHRCR